jgi:hypothetical protein
MTDEVDAAEVPSFGDRVIGVPKDDEDPCRDQANPSDKPMMPFKHTMNDVRAELVRSERLTYDEYS